MAKLAGDAYVYAEDGKVYAPGDTLPKELAHLSDEADTSSADVSESAGSGDVDQDVEIEALGVPELRKELDKAKVEYSQADRKDRLVQLVKAARAS